ncbi:MAG: glycosyltransferase 87 family protein [Chthoniobacteraceae bacterium]|jgi:hypothetical protein
MRGSAELPPNASTRLAGVAAAVLTAGALVLLFLLMLSMGLRRGFNHDESQHLAAGAIIARGHLLPYRDFPYFHMPDLALVYALLFRASASVLLPARLFSVGVGWLTCLLLWFIVWRECRDKSTPARWLLPAAAVLLMAGNPIFRDTFWRTWNHELATLAGIGAAALAMYGGRRWFLAGVCLGLAIGTRLTFAPLFAPLAVAAVLEPVGGDFRQRAARVGLFSTGAALALLPALILFAMVPAQFLFGNFTFNSKVNVLFRQSHHDTNASLAAKLLFPFTTLFHDRANLLLALIFVLFVAAALLHISKMRPDARYRLLLVLALIPFTLIGAVAPSPSQIEYYYELVPLMVLAIALSAATFPSERGAWICAILLLAPGGYVMARAWNDYQHLAILKTPSAWPPVMVHEAGVETAGLVHSGGVLTLDPLYPLEGGLNIYPSLATGPIAWRSEPFVPPPDRARFRILGPDNFTGALTQSPPAAILTTPSIIVDKPLTDWARAHGYMPHLLQNRGKLLDRATVWTRP